MGNHDTRVHHPWRCRLLTLCDLFMPKNQDRKILGWIGFVAILAAIVSLIGLLDHEADIDFIRIRLGLMPLPKPLN